MLPLMMCRRFAVVAAFVLVVVAGASRRVRAEALGEQAGVGGAMQSGGRGAVFALDADGDDDDDDDRKAPAGRYFFVLLDGRSSYGRDFFPDPFLGPEFDRENQLELEYLHAEGRGMRSQEVGAQVQWNPIGQLTLSAEFGWDAEHQSLVHAGGGDGDDGGDGGAGGTGLESVDLAAYHPVFQFVSADRAVDYTAIGRLDVSIPTRTAASGGNVQLTPYLGQMLRLGEHVSVQGWVGTRFTIAPNQATVLNYGTMLGYRIPRRQWALPLTAAFTPMFELDGQRPLSSRGGQDALVGVAGFDWQLRGGGKLQPQIELGYQFPVDQGAREQLRWGVVVQVFFEF